MATVDLEAIRALRKDVDSDPWPEYEYVGRPYMQERQLTQPCLDFYLAAHSAIPLLLARVEELEHLAAARMDTIDADYRAQKQVEAELNNCECECDELVSERQSLRIERDQLRALLREACDIAGRLCTDSGNWKPSDVHDIKRIRAEGGIR